MPVRGILDRIENDRDNLDIENRATEILGRIDRDRKRFEEHRKKTADMLIRIEKRQTTILAISVVGAFLSSISLILSAAIVSM